MRTPQHQRRTTQHAGTTMMPLPLILYARGRFSLPITATLPTPSCPSLSMQGGGDSLLSCLPRSECKRGPLSSATQLAPRSLCGGEDLPVASYSSHAPAPTSPAAPVSHTASYCMMPTTTRRNVGSNDDCVIWAICKFFIFISYLYHLTNMTPSSSPPMKHLPQMGQSMY